MSRFVGGGGSDSWGSLGKHSSIGQIQRTVAQVDAIRSAHVQRHALATDQNPLDMLWRPLLHDVERVLWDFPPLPWMLSHPEPDQTHHEDGEQCRNEEQRH